MNYGTGWNEVSRGVKVLSGYKTPSASLIGLASLDRSVYVWWGITIGQMFFGFMWRRK